jgi:hypothetical protein
VSRKTSRERRRKRRLKGEKEANTKDNVIKKDERKR